MNLMVDGTALTFRRAGIGRYTYEMILRFARADGVRLRLSNFSLRPAGVRVPSPLTPDTFDAFIRRQRPWAILFHLLTRLSREPVVAAQARAAGTDIYFAPNYLGVYGRSFRTVITVHDLVYHLYPQYTQPAMLKALTAAMPRQLDRADRIVVDAESTRRDLVRVFGVEPARIRVVPLAAGREFTRVTDPVRLRAVRARYGLPERFVLFVGTVEPRKNLLTLFKTLDQLHTRGLKVPLVVVGATGWNAAAEMNRLSELAAERRACHLGYVPDADLPAVYSLADVFVFPSWYEGFGIPPLEAMGCGVPVVCSNSSSLPEVCGDAAEYFDPHSADELADRMAAVLADQARAAELSARGIARAARFSWDRTAAELMTIFNECVNRATPGIPPASPTHTSPS